MLGVPRLGPRARDCLGWSQKLETSRWWASCWFPILLPSEGAGAPPPLPPPFPFPPPLPHTPPPPPYVWREGLKCRAKSLGAGPCHEVSWAPCTAPCRSSPKRRGKPRGKLRGVTRCGQPATGNLGFPARCPLSQRFFLGDSVPLLK